MIIPPKKLGSNSLPFQDIKIDKKTCAKYGPAGIGTKAVYLNSFYFERCYYIPLTDVKRAFKRVAIAKGSIKASIPYLVVVYDDNKEKQCIFKLEQDVDALLNRISEDWPTIRIGKG
ncbi:MAG: hypothetical protein ACERKZ_03520 [Lachnotalea sp.]